MANDPLFGFLVFNSHGSLTHVACSGMADSGGRFLGLWQYEAATVCHPAAATDLHIKLASSPSRIIARSYENDSKSTNFNHSGW